MIGDRLIEHGVIFSVTVHLRFQTKFLNLRIAIMGNMSNLERIAEMVKCYKNNDLILSVLDERSELSDESLREIQLCVDRKPGNKCLTVIVFDEYKDAEIQNPILWLHMILDTCQGFEEAKDYQEWRKNEGYKDTAFFQLLYQQYSVVIPKIRDIVGQKVKAIDSYHIEFRTDIVETLRSYEL